MIKMIEVKNADLFAPIIIQEKNVRKVMLPLIEKENYILLLI